MRAVLCKRASGHRTSTNNNSVLSDQGAFFMLFTFLPWVSGCRKMPHVLRYLLTSKSVEAKKSGGLSNMDIVNGFIHIVNGIYEFLWGDLIAIPLPGGGTVGISLLVLLLIPAGIFFTVRLRFPQIRLFPDMIRAVTEKNDHSVKGSISGFQTLIIATATRVGMGNLVGVVAAGAGAVFWMWITAILGSATAFVEATLAQLYREKDPLYGGFRGTPAYYIQDCFGRKGKKSIIAVLFAISGLICWCGISQVISNSVSSAFENAFHIPALYTTIVLVILAAVIVLRKNATVKVLDILVPIMATWSFAITLFIIF